MKRLSRPILAAMLVLFCSGGAVAEGYVFASLGAAFTQDADFNPEGLPELGKVKMETGVSAEIGGGKWFSSSDFVHVGAQAGIGYFRPTADTLEGSEDSEFHVIPLSILAMARVPLLVSEDRPYGLLQPYVGIGPSFVLTVADFQGVGTNTTFLGFDVGFDVRAGLKVNVTDSMGVFVEYKHIEFDANLNDAEEHSDLADVGLDFVSDHATVGVAFYF